MRYYVVSLLALLFGARIFSLWAKRAERTGKNFLTEHRTTPGSYISMRPRRARFLHTNCVLRLLASLVGLFIREEESFDLSLGSDFSGWTSKQNLFKESLVEKGE